MIYELVSNAGFYDIQIFNAPQHFARDILKDHILRASKLNPEGQPGIQIASSEGNGAQIILSHIYAKHVAEVLRLINGQLRDLSIQKREEYEWTTMDSFDLPLAVRTAYPS